MHTIPANGIDTSETYWPRLRTRVDQEQGKVCKGLRVAIESPRYQTRLTGLFIGIRIVCEPSLRAGSLSFCAYKRCVLRDKEDLLGTRSYFVPSRCLRARRRRPEGAQGFDKVVAVPQGNISPPFLCLKRVAEGSASGCFQLLRPRCNALTIKGDMDTQE